MQAQANPIPTNERVVAGLPFVRGAGAPARGVDASLDRPRRPGSGRCDRPDRCGAAVRRRPRHQVRDVRRAPRARGDDRRAPARSVAAGRAPSAARTRSRARDVAPRARPRAVARRPGGRRSGPTRSASAARFVRINTIESTSPLSAGDHVDERSLPAVLVPSEPESPDSAYERTRGEGADSHGDGDAAASASGALIDLYYFGEVTMKQIGEELGVNESRVSQLHARAMQRLRAALEPARPARAMGQPARTLPVITALTPRVPNASRPVLPFARPVMAKASLPPCRRSRGRHGPALHEHFAGRPQQVGEPERLREPAAAGVLEEPFRFGAGDVAGDEDHAARERRVRHGDGAVERHPVDARHLQVADNQVVGSGPHARESLPPRRRRGRPRNPRRRARLRQPAPAPARPPPAARSRRAEGPAPITSGGGCGARTAVASPVGSSTKNEAPPAPLRAIRSRFGRRAPATIA